MRTLKSEPRNLSSSRPPPPPRVNFKIGGMEKIGGELSWQNWLLTFEARQQMAKYVGFGGTLVIMTGFYCFKLLFLVLMRDEYKEEGPQVRLGKKLQGIEEDSNATPKLMKLFSDCKERAGIDDDRLDQIEIFHSSLLDPVVAGTTYTKQGALVGLPSHMLEEEVAWRKMRVKTHFNKFFKGFVIPNDISQEDEEELKRLLLATPEEQKFLMSFSLCKVNTWTAIKDTALPVIFWPLVYFTGFNINNKLNLFTKPRFMRVGIQAVSATICLVLYICYVNMSSLESDTDALAEACKTKDEVEVAIGYFEKVLERNKLLRRLLGKEMENYVQEDGELVPLFYELDYFSRLSSRLYFLKHLLQKFE